MRIGNDIEVIVCRLDGGRVRLGIVAPKDVPIWREELLAQLIAEGKPTTSPVAESA